jgi:tRNA A37 threonylcarbamoyladenosine modification protein TsaB
MGGSFMILVIDGSNPEHVNLGILAENRANWHKFAPDYDFSEKFTLEIQKFLKKSKVSLGYMTKIAVFVGPGPFSRIRTAVVAANALAFALNIPVIGVSGKNPDFTEENLNSLPESKRVTPLYEREPNITLPKT